MVCGPAVTLVAGSSQSYHPSGARGDQCMSTPNVQVDIHWSPRAPSLSPGEQTLPDIYESHVSAQRRLGTRGDGH